jgi:hypothetical protein
MPSVGQACAASAGARCSGATSDIASRSTFAEFVVAFAASRARSGSDLLVGSASIMTRRCYIPRLPVFGVDLASWDDLHASA